MKTRRRGSARVPLDRIERLFGHRRKLEEQLDRLDAVIGMLLMRLAYRNVHTRDIARRLARALEQQPTRENLTKLDARIRQSRTRVRRRARPLASPIIMATAKG